MKAMIEIKGLQFSYQVQPVLQDVCCHIHAGDFVALVGPNGSGKSTLLKCINRILRPQKGSITINEREVATIVPAELARFMAYVPQSQRRQYSTTVFDAVLTGRKPHIGWRPVGKDFDYVSDTLRYLHLEALSDKRVNELSGGQQQMVMIARALAQEPNILLLDEPTANLDIRHQFEVLELLRELCRRGITIIIAIHDINMAIRYASHIMMLKEGRIFAYGEQEVVTSENIGELYNINVEIIRRDDNLYILPVGLPNHFDRHEE